MVSIPRRPRIDFHLWVGGLLLASFSAPSIAAIAFQPLGTLDNNSQLFSFAEAISPDGGTVAGRGTDQSNNMQSLLWTSAGGLHGLGPPPNMTLYFSSARGVSSNGAYVVGYNQQNAGRYFAYRWSAGGGWQDLGDLPGGNNNNLAMGVSQDGNVVVGYGNYLSSAAQGFVWRSGQGMVSIGDLPGGPNFSQAQGVSSDGQVVVGGSQDAVDFQAVRWTQAGGLQALPHLPGGTGGFANATNFDGSLIVGDASTATGAHACLWNSGGVFDLGDLPGGQDLSIARALSADGGTIVGMSDTGVGTVQHEAFIWDAQHGMRNLRNVLQTDFGINMNGWILEDAYGISADGLTIVGDGTNPAGELEGWIATIPEPTTLMSLVAIAAAGQGRRRNRSRPNHV